MPLPININSLIHARSVESERLEFKSGWNPETILHTMCAFANDFHNLGGGYIIIGIAEKDALPILPPSGLEITQIDRVQKEILHLGHNAIQPYYHPIMEPVIFDGKHVLVLWVPGGQTRPYKAKVSLSKDASDWGYYIRKGSSTVRARGADENELLSLAATVPFDDRINQQAYVEDLSRDLMQEYLKKVKSDLVQSAPQLSLVELGRQMGVVGGPIESPFPINVGLMMFNPEPDSFFPAMQIDVVWFTSAGAGGDRFSEKIFRGPLPHLVPEVLDFIQRNFISETVIKHPDRAEATRVENFPRNAIEEAVVNAVYHRGYDTREPVETRITRDDIVVLNYPGPDRSVRLEQLRAGRAISRRYRNRRIGEFLKELDLTEGRSTGIPKIIHAMAQNGSPPPEFEFDEDHSYFMVRLPVHPLTVETGSGINLNTPQIQGAESGAESILTVLEQRPLSSAEIARNTGRKSVTGALKRSLRSLIESGLIEMTIPDNPGSRMQKYRITDKGKLVLLQREKSEH